MIRRGGREREGELGRRGRKRGGLRGKRFSLQEPVYVQSGQAVDVRGLGLLLFRDVVLNETSLGAALRDCMLDIVARERNGERSER